MLEKDNYQEKKQEGLFLVDLHGPSLKLRDPLDSENHFIEGVTKYKDIQTILDSPSEELLEKVFIRANFYENNYEICMKNLKNIFLEYRSLRERLGRLFNIELKEKLFSQYHDYIGRYEAIPESFETLKELSERKISWEFQSGITYKWASELGILLTSQGFSKATASMRRSENPSSDLTKVANVEYNIRQNKKVAILDDDPHVIDLFTRLWDVDCFYIYSEEDFYTKRRAYLDSELIKLGRKGEIHFNYNIPKAAQELFFN